LKESLEISTLDLKATQASAVSILEVIPCASTDTYRGMSLQLIRKNNRKQAENRMN
jgi:hypothetical protein